MSLCTFFLTVGGGACDNRIMNRTVYKREYMRKYRAQKKTEKGYLTERRFFASMSCVDIATADALGHGVVNAWAALGDVEKACGSTIAELFAFFNRLPGSASVYLDNAKAWGRFILAHALKNGYKCVTHEPAGNQFKVFIDKSLNWNAIALRCARGVIYIRDFMAILKSPLSDLEKSFGTCDFTPILSEWAGEKGTPCVSLLKTCLRGAMAQKSAYFRFSDEIKNITGVSIFGNTISSIGKNQLFAIYGEGEPMIGKKRFRETFPVLPKTVDDDIRKSGMYQSGLNLLKNSAKQYTGAGVVLDKKSMYPAIYCKCALPYGNAFRYTYADFVERCPDRAQFYVIYKITELSAELKPDGIPAIRITNNEKIDPGKYLSKISLLSNAPAIMLDSNDYEILFENYNVFSINIDYVYVFRKKVHEELRRYGEIFFTEKERNKGTARGVAAKFLCNTITGQFGANPYKTEYTIKDGHFEKAEENYIGGSGYLPVACCINSMGRLILSRTIRANYENYLYGDTDSMHLKTTDLTAIKGVKIGDGLGDWTAKIFNACKFIGRKIYAEKFGDEWKYTVAGASPEMFEKIKDGKIFEGMELRGGIYPKVYPDMTIAFAERTYTIAKNDILF